MSRTDKTRPWWVWHHLRREDRRRDRRRSRRELRACRGDEH
ncbi:hypothetical protein [Saccharothrix xinjiangensis]|uniref:Uncharacterized protein n=1 Tax=Saccharothrix xinjiangensis TaxID=204798 RepID=A0ABV9XYA7_9PSEU